MLDRLCPIPRNYEAYSLQRKIFRSLFKYLRSVGTREWQEAHAIGPDERLLTAHGPDVQCGCGHESEFTSYNIPYDAWRVYRSCAYCRPLFVSSRAGVSTLVCSSSGLSVL
jgi:hypothetical protein